MIQAKTYHIKTWGCQMNVYDSDRMGEILKAEGYTYTDDPTDASMVILNTCHIREKATEKVFSDIGRLAKLKERRQHLGLNLIIGVVGCVAQAEGKEIFTRAKAVDFVLGSQAWNQLPTILKNIQEKNKRQWNTDFTPEEKFDSVADLALNTDRIRGSSAFLTIQEGCDKFCTYCVVPYTRGAEFSRPLNQIIQEAQALVHHGAKEITLLGQNVNAYHGLRADGTQSTLAELITLLAEKTKVKRLRYTTSYPAEITDALIDVHGSVPQLMPLLHLPMQSGSNTILKAMNRRHTNEEYRILVDKLKKARADMVLSSDFIVGFPGETDGDFQETLKIVQDIGFIQSYAFTYSPRPGTPASTYTNQVPQEVMDERLHILQETLEANQRKFNAQWTNKTMTILCDRQGKKEGQLLGRSPYMQPVHIDTTLPLMGELVSVRITKDLPNSLHGELL